MDGGAQASHGRAEGACFGSPPPNQPPEPEASWTRLPTPRPHRPTICHPRPNTRTGVYKCLPMAVYMCLPVMMTTETTTGKAKQATQECSNDTNRPEDRKSTRLN